LHNEKVPRIWLCSYDVADAVRHDPEDALDSRAKVTEQHHVLALHDYRFELGESTHTINENVLLSELTFITALRPLRASIDLNVHLGVIRYPIMLYEVRQQPTPFRFPSSLVCVVSVC
jgi:hypothetical protein